MHQDITPASTRATSSLAEIFCEILTSRFDLNFEEFEDAALKAGHEIMASALGLALEALDARFAPIYLMVGTFATGEIARF